MRRELTGSSPTPYSRAMYAERNPRHGRAANGRSGHGVVAGLPSRERSMSRVEQSAVVEDGEAEKGRMMRHLCEIGEFVRRMKIHTRFGDLSRAKLKLLRFEIRGGEAECNLLARPADPWDAGLPAAVAERNVSAQALKDAISVRALMFRVLPDISKAVLRVYRKSGESFELVIAGVVRREEEAPATVRSLAMRAKLCGLQFWLDDGILESLHPEECLVGA
jgi:hypothetical protein